MLEIDPSLLQILNMYSLRLSHIVISARLLLSATGKMYKRGTFGDLALHSEVVSGSRQKFESIGSNVKMNCNEREKKIQVEMAYYPTK